MAISKSSARWDGGLRTGKGTMKPAHTPEAPFSVGSRFEGQPQSNPEELLGAALAGCFSMALSGALEQAGTPAQSIETSADVRIEKQGDGFSITGIELTTAVTAVGIDAETLRTIALRTTLRPPATARANAPSAGSHT